MCKRRRSQRSVSCKQQLWEPSGVFDICSRSSLLLQQHAPWDCAGGWGSLGRAFGFAEDSHAGIPPAYLSDQLPFLNFFFPSFSFPPVCNVSIQCLWSQAVLCTCFLELIKTYNIPPLSPRQPGSMVQLLEGAECVMVHRGCLSVRGCLSSVCSRSTGHH